MILADTSVWIDHLRSGDSLTELLTAGEVLMHPVVAGELSMGSLKDRKSLIEDLLDLPRAIVASDEETRRLIETEKLYGRGIGYLDAQLLASARLTPGAVLWTFDRRLAQAALDLGVSASRH